MRKYQRGVTAIGWLILLVPIAIVFYAGIRISPLYPNYMKVTHSLEAVATEISNEGQTADGLRNAVDKHFQIESVDYPDKKDLKITRVNNVWQIEANYDDQSPLFANIAILITFDKIVKLKSGGGE
jgi:Domain of unknown function (DUF4845)